MSNILKEIRWQQRFVNLNKSYINMETAVLQNKLNTIELAGLIQFFEITFELTWKTLKDYLESEGILAGSPREVIKQSFSLGVLKDGEMWLDALDKKNLMTHTYEEEMPTYAVSLIKNKYAKLFQDLIDFLNKKLFPVKKFGLSLSSYISIIQIFALNSEITSVKIFGSRALVDILPSLKIS